MFNKLTDSWPTSRVQIGVTAALPHQMATNDNLIWNNFLFDRRVGELGVAGASNLQRSLLKYLDNIVEAVDDEMLDGASFDVMRSDLAPISRFLGFVGLSTLLLHTDMSTDSSRQRLSVAIQGVIIECRKYCGQYS